VYWFVTANIERGQTVNLSNEAIAAIFGAMAGGIMGMLGSFITIPLSALASFLLKEHELRLKSRLDQIADQRRLLLEHQLEKERTVDKSKLDELEQRIARIESIVSDD
jgi:hypothetical protein